jgi:CBS domain-containing protein
MILVRDVLRNKAPRVWTIGPQATVYEALEVMAERNIGALPVVESGQVIGIFSERDYARKVVLLGRSSREITVGDLMSSPVITVGPSETIQTCMELMTDHRIRHLPVLEGAQMVGLVSVGDVVKAIIDEQRVLIHDLENYITGTSR